jgi:AcrR family transcriptional regulator
MSRKQKTRERIMKAALELFSKQGYFKTTTREIADLAEINELTLFRHFGTKENLFQQTTQAYVQDINIKGEIEQFKNQPFEESIRAIALDYLEFCQQNTQLYKIQMHLSDNMKDFVRLKLSRGYQKELQEYFTELEKEEKIKGNPEKMSVVFINSILGAFTVYVLTNNTFTEIPLEALVIEQANQFAQYYKK